MLPGEPGVRVSVGLSGAGKTFGQKSQIYASAMHHPVIAIDRMKEWSTVPKALAPYVAYRSSKGGPITTIEEGIAYANKGAKLVIVRAPAGVASPDLVDKACKWACEYPGVAGVVVPEAHNAMPNKVNSLPEYIAEVATAWRHHRVAMFVDTQRLALLNTTVRDLSREMRLYAITGKADLAACDEIHSSIRTLVTECARRLAPISEGGSNEPGWHVRLGLVRVPPFAITREL